MYAVKFNQGFYAKKQPNFSWSFTKDINDAKLYKTKSGAVDRLAWGQRIGLFGKLFDVNVILTIEELPDKVFTCETFNCDKGITEEEYYNCNRRCKIHNKNYDRRQKTMEESKK